jgi:glycosyltransferase involved in cell wall biosynthesis
MVSICILSWNCLNTLKKTIEILSKLKIENEIIVYDQNSNDGSTEYLDKLDIQKTLSKTNTGISFARNYMVRHSLHDYVLLLDADIVPIINSIECMYKFMANNNDFAYLGYDYKNYTKNYSFSTTLEKEISLKDVCLLYSKDNRNLCLKKNKISQNKIALTQYGIFKKNVLLESPFPEFTPFDKEGWGCEDNIVGITICDNELGKGGMIKNRVYYHEKNSSKKSLGNSFHIRYLERCACLKYFEKFLCPEQKINSLKSSILPKTKLNIKPSNNFEKISNLFYFFDFNTTANSYFSSEQIIKFIIRAEENSKVENYLNYLFEKLLKFVIA